MEGLKQFAIAYAIVGGVCLFAGLIIGWVL